MGPVLALLWTLAALLAAVVLALALPWHVELSGRTGPTPEARLRLRLGSARLPALLSVDLMRNRGETGEQAPGERRPGNRKGGRKGRRTRRALSGRLLSALPRLVADTLAGVHLDRLRLAGRFGLGDPAVTGELWGRLCPLLYMPRDPRLEIDVVPDFDSLRIDGEGLVALHARPLRLAAPALGLVLREGLRW